MIKNSVQTRIKHIVEIDQNPLLDGVTLSGGEPMLHIEPLIKLCKEVRKRNLNIIIYSGFTYEEIIVDSRKIELLKLCDMLVDGKFDIDSRSLSLLYRGSSNQRLINIQKSLENNRVIEYKVYNDEIKI